MPRKIRKLTELKNPESFIQINLIKGFKYIDKAGEVVNSYFDGDKSPVFQMSLDSLVIKNPALHIPELKISPSVLWMKFNTTSIPLSTALDIWSKESSKIGQILDITHVSRIGWRNYFIYELTSEEENILSEKVNLIQDFSTGSLSLILELPNELKGTLHIQLVQKEATESEQKGLLFDIDLYKDGKIALDDVQNVLKPIKEYLTNSFYEKINEFLKAS